MSDDLAPNLLDKRTIERNLRTGKVEDKQWEKHLKSLVDVSEKAVAVESNMGDIDEEEDDDSEE
jgi:hypothetical protein